MCSGFLHQMEESECYPAIKALNINMESVTCIIVSSYLRHRRWTKVVFPPPSVCEQDISKSCGWVKTKLGGQVGSVARTSRFDFGEDLDLGHRWDTKCNLFSLAEVRAPPSAVPVEIMLQDVNLFLSLQISRYWCGIVMQPFGEWDFMRGTGQTMAMKATNDSQTLNQLHAKWRVLCIFLRQPTGPIIPTFVWGRPGNVFVSSLSRAGWPWFGDEFRNCLGVPVITCRLCERFINRGINVQVYQKDSRRETQLNIHRRDGTLGDATHRLRSTNLTVYS